MVKRLSMILAGLFLSIGIALAQSQVTGTVTDDNGEPVAGAGVKVVGTNTGTATNSDGHFSLSAPANSTLEITFLGMEPKRVKAGRNLHISLVSKDQTLDELMVVAYGTAKKSAFTGSAAVVKAGDIGKVQATNAAEALKGKVSGVQLTQSTGQPGTAPTIRIRGISSITAKSDPLFVVDGSPFDGDINTISPSDIESMTVLKEAAAAALYGARGANGVVIITTKSGANKGNSTITVDAKWGSNSRQVPDYNYISSPAGYYETWYKGLENYATNAMGYNQAQANAWANANLTANNTYGLAYNVYSVPTGQTLIGLNGKLNPNATLGNYVEYGGQKYFITPDDYVDATYRNALRQEYTVTATGSTQKSNFYASANYLDMKGITVGSQYKRFTTRLKADYQLKPWLKVGMNVNYAHYDSDNVSGDGDGLSSGNMFSMTAMAPIYPLYIRDAKGNIIQHEASGRPLYDFGDGKQIGLTRPFLTQANPLCNAYVDTNHNNGNTFNAVGTIDIDLPYGFRFSSTNSTYVDEYRGQGSSNPWFGVYATYNGIASVSHGRTWSYNYQQLLKWHQLYGKHDITAMLGHEYYRRRIYSLSGSNNNMFSNNIVELSAAVTTMSIAGSSTSDYNTEGFFGQLQYNYDNKYFASASYRRDASSYFDPDHRWGNFWSIGGAWLLNKEAWFNVSWLDELKLKASYGEQGNDRIGYYNYITTYNIVNSNGALALTPRQLGNSKISWEKGGEFNIGLEFAALNSRLTGSVEYYYRKTSDMLSWFSLPASFGFTGYYDNIGDMRNTGLEVELRGDVIRTKDLTWSVYGNITTNSNKILKIADANKVMVVDGVSGYSSSNHYYGEGKPLYTWYMYKYAGVDKETGEALYYKNVYQKDDNGAVIYYDAAGNVVDASSKGARPKVIGQETTNSTGDADEYLFDSANPDAFGGFGTSLSYKGFDFSVDFTYQLGGYVYDGDYAASMSMSRGHAMHADILNAWSPTNKSSNIPRLQFNDKYTTATCDRFLTSASYLNLQNITLGYTLPKNVVRNIGLANVRVYFSADNIWLWSKRQGLDPRQSASGSVTSQIYSPIRSISGGISVSF